MSMNLIDINHIPVPTWRWLKINSSKIKVPFKGDINKYSQKSLSSKDEFLSGELYTQATEDAEIKKNILIEKNAALENPMVIRLKGNSKDKDVIWNINLTAEEESRGEIILVFEGDEECEEAYFNGVFDLNIKERSKVKVTILQNTGVKDTSLLSMRAEVQKYGEIDIAVFEFGGGIAHSKILCNLSEDSKADLGAVYLQGGNQNLHVNYIMNHHGKRSESDIKAYGALSGEAKKIFKGTLDFKRGAHQAKGTEEEYVMLLSPKARNLSAPLLLCEEDDVQGEHAASSGNIDKDKLFYLTSRGLSQEEAKRIMITSLFNPIIDKIDHEEIKQEINNIINLRMEREGVVDGL